MGSSVFLIPKRNCFKWFVNFERRVVPAWESITRLLPIKAWAMDITVHFLQYCISSRISTFIRFIVSTLMMGTEVFLDKWTWMALDCLSGRPRKKEFRFDSFFKDDRTFVRLSRSLRRQKFASIVMVLEAIKRKKLWIWAAVCVYTVLLHYYNVITSGMLSGSYIKNVYIFLNDIICL